MTTLLFLALILACPLMMIWMMRGGHGHGGGAEGGHAHDQDGGGDGHVDTGAGSRASVEELRRRPEELDRLIEEREADEETPTPVAGDRRRALTATGSGRS